MALTHFSLFSGIGGIDLAAEWAGFETVGQCEWADFPTKVLEKHWPDVPRWRDVRTVTRDSFEDATGLRTVDLISGGFPCQPFSVAGKQRGESDDRYLWPEMLRVISELRPAWVLGENVANIVNLALDQVCAELECIGYEVQPFIIPAASVNAPHRRERCFIVAHSNGVGQWTRHEPTKPTRDSAGQRFGNGGVVEQAWTVAHPDGKGLQGSGEAGNFGCKGPDFYKQPAGCRDGARWWATEPRMGRVAYGISNRAHRLKALGNAVVPQQVYPILKAIAEIETAIQSGV